VSSTSPFSPDQVQEAADLILDHFAESPAYTYPMRFALAIGQRVSFSHTPLNPPVLDIGVNDGCTARLIHHGKGRITWGGDMPEESTYESRGLYVEPQYNLYEHLVGLDVCDIPFPDDSFNTIVSTEVFFYGMDRERLLSELVRVLAPGGTLAFSESSQEILRFPALTRELKKYVPTLNILEDPCAYYEGTLSRLGMKDLFVRPYFDRSLAAFTLAQLYAGPPGADSDEYRRLIQEDPRFCSIYRDGLRALAAGMENEFSLPAGPPHGWHVFVTGKKPGEMRPGLPTPAPSCLFCGQRDLELSLRACRCPGCSRTYQVRFGVPYLLRDYGTAYSAKSDSNRTRNQVIEDRIDQALGASLAALREDLKSGSELFLIGIDAATSFTLRRLGADGVQVAAIGASNERHVGKDVDGIPISSIADLAARDGIALLSGFQDSAAPEPALLRAAGFRGRILYFPSEDIGLREWNAPAPPPALHTPLITRIRARLARAIQPG
jgi:SAM-dependent methyltransferase